MSESLGFMLSRREPQELVDLAHPLGVAPGQVVVDRDHVGALAAQGVEVDRQGRHQGLALAGLHFGDHAPMEHDPAHHLDVEMALAEGPLGGLAHGGKGLHKQVVQLFAGRHPLPETIGAGANFLVAERSFADPKKRLGSAREPSTRV
jgi:hypothetical protein